MIQALVDCGFHVVEDPTPWDSETAKNELGFDHNETCSWRGWRRHVGLVMLAFAMTAAIRHRANHPTPPKRRPG